MLVFMLNILIYITVSRAVCQQKKESYIQKSDFPFFFLSLFIILEIEQKVSRNQIKIFLIKTIQRYKNNVIRTLI